MFPTTLEHEVRGPAAPVQVSTVLGALDAAGKRSAGKARTVATSAVRRKLPARTETLRRATTGSVRRTPDGYRIVVQPRPVRYARARVTAREVARFVSGGTGVHGPTGRPIRPRHAEAFPEPFGQEVEGQRATHPFERAQAAEGAVVARILAQGAQEGARDAERALGRRR